MLMAWECPLLQANGLISDSNLVLSRRIYCDCHFQGRDLRQVPIAFGGKRVITCSSSKLPTAWRNQDGRLKLLVPPLANAVSRGRTDCARFSFGAKFIFIQVSPAWAFSCFYLINVLIREPGSAIDPPECLSPSGFTSTGSEALTSCRKMQGSNGPSFPSSPRVLTVFLFVL